MNPSLPPATANSNHGISSYLLHRIQERAEHRALSDEEWQAPFQSLVIDRPLIGAIPLRRTDWYDNDGR